MGLMGRGSVGGPSSFDIGRRVYNDPHKRVCSMLDRS
jgi:hypothetical protein